MDSLEGILCLGIFNVACPRWRHPIVRKNQCDHLSQQFNFISSRSPIPVTSGFEQDSGLVSQLWRVWPDDFIGSVASQGILRVKCGLVRRVSGKSMATCT
ncbi:hypothetical protein CDAR_387751 [Caerostris darwini]|uniref:Uncharacterized protein n=1 Tax=Caerostris darwini TaxID=1538125 RepID=A0AAV4SRK7_9ARAC|nr:hypothetical protein CDAR_387751 [Caerostris darwini]